MIDWIRVSLILCSYGFFREMRPSEPFVSATKVGENERLMQMRFVGDRILIERCVEEHNVGTSEPRDLPIRDLLVLSSTVHRFLSH